MHLPTAEDVLKYVHDNSLEGLMVHIAMNNRRGYSFMPIEVKDMFKKDGKSYIRTELMVGDEQDIPAEVSDEDIEAFKKGYRDYSAVITAHGEEDAAYYVLAVAIPKNTPKNYDKDIDDLMVDEIIKDMSRYMDIKTSGAIKVLTQEAEEEYDKWQGSIAIPSVSTGRI